MNHLVLIRVAAALDADLRGAVLREIRDDGLHRLRLVFEHEQRGLGLAVSLHPERPWLGRPALRRRPAGGPPTRLAALAARTLRGAVLERVQKFDGDRIVALRFADHSALVVELATHRANAILLDPSGRTVACAKHPRSAARRLAPGATYAPPEVPSTWVDPFRATEGELVAVLERRRARGESLFDALRGGLFGLGREAAGLIVTECSEQGRTPIAVLRERLDQLRGGALEPVIDAVDSGAEAFDATRADLLPWRPAAARAGRVLLQREDAAATAGWFHDRLEQAGQSAAWGRGLVELLEREIERVDQATNRVEQDLAAFADPEQFRRQGEALLAGLRRARRVGAVILVPDPYDAEAATISIPADPGLSPTAAAEECFRRHRRARRALERGGARRQWLGSRRRRLGSLRQQVAEPLTPQAVTELEGAMREAGIPVGLEIRSGMGRPGATAARPRLEGVRLFIGVDGESVLVGRHGSGNQRLTFKLAGPEDFWFHALGVPGAHVVLRNPAGCRRPSEAALHEAGSIAAWFSDARNESMADVQWTRRKYVRKLRGAAPGTVTLKRAATVRVRPRLPDSAGDDE